MELFSEEKQLPQSTGLTDARNQILIPALKSSWMMSRLFGQVAFDPDDVFGKLSRSSADSN
jgi:hypothetical protein